MATPRQDIERQEIMSIKIVPVIMAGGKGTRLWPLSRAAAAKQFIRFLGDETLLQKTMTRVSDEAIYAAPIIVTNEDFRFLVAEQAREIGVKLDGIILEPEARNTAAAVAAAAVLVGQRHGRDAIVQILPSDHEITVDDTYRACVEKAALAARDGKIVTFGITPTEPATGYGYIEIGEDLGNGVHAVSRFVEKPNAEVAEKMLASGNYAWNSGMFVFSAGQMISELQAFAPDVLAAVEQAVDNAKGDLDFTRLDAESFAKSPSISIDYAVMEKPRTRPSFPPRSPGPISAAGMRSGSLRWR